MKRCSILHRGSFEADIVCLIYGPCHSAGLRLRLCRKRGACAFRGKKKRSRSHAIPWHTINLVFWTHTCRKLLQKAISSDSLSSGEAAEIRSSATTCTTQLVRRLLGFGVPSCASRVPSIACQVNSHLTFGQSCNSAPSVSMNHSTLRRTSTRLLVRLSTYS